MRYEKFDDHDPYFQGKVNQTQTNFLNFAPSMSPNNPEMLFYSGNAFSLSRRFSSISDRELQQYKEVRMNVTGSQIKEGNRCCVLWTIIMGSIFLFPLFFICCDWWKKMTNKLYHVENQAYDTIINLLRQGYIEEFYLNIQDNFFSQSKGEAIVEALRYSKIKNFNFKNVAGGFDTEGPNYSDFTNYMKPIKSMNIRSDITWGNKVVLK